MPAVREKRAFVSSTAHDLRAIRDEVRIALRRFGYVDVAMEYLAAEDVRPLDKCLALVGESDLFVLIVAWRYGFIPPGEDRSITEFEYDAARRKGIPCIVLLVSETAHWPLDWADRDVSRVEEFRARVAREHIVAFFEGRDDAAARLYESLRLVQEQTATIETDAEEHRLTEALGTLRERQQRQYQSFRLFDFHEDIHVDEIYVQEVLRSKTSRSPYDGLQIAARQMAPPMRDSAVLERITAGDRRNPVSVFEGRAGAGKSTMLKMWLFTLLRETPDPSRPFPLFASLRHLQFGGGSPSETLAATICRSSPGVDAAHVTLLLAADAGPGPERPAVVLLLDGLDEMSPDARSPFLSGIASLPAKWPVIMSTRPGVLAGTGYPVRSRCYELCDFDEEQIRAFVQQWFAKEPALAAALLERIESSSRLRALAAIPLLVTCLAIHVQLYGGWALPANVAEDALLRHSVEILIDGWDAMREGRRPDVRFLETSFRVFAALTTYPRHQNVPYAELLRIVDACIGDPAGREAFVNRVLRNGRIVTAGVTEGIAFSHGIFYDFFFAERLGATSS